MSELTPRDKKTLEGLYSKLAEYRRDIDRIARAQDTRLTTLGPNESITFLGEDGEPALKLGGPGSNRGEILKYINGPVPEAPGEPLITGGAGVIHVTLGDGAEPSDAKLCRVHASLDPNFEPSAATMIGSVQPGNRSVSLSTPAGTWHCCVQWLTLSGKESEVSPVVTVEVDAMVDMSELVEVQEQADEKWAQANVRIEEGKTAIANAEAKVKAVEELFESMPEPLELEEAIQQAKDAIAQLGNVTDRLQAAETTIQTVANETSQNLAELETTLSNSFTQGINAAKIEAADTAEEKAEAAKIAAVNEAAANAQTEYDKLQKAADEALQAAVTAAGNLWPDPSFEMGGKGMNASANWEIVEDSRARHGSHVLRMVNAGTVYQADFLPAENDDYLHCEAWICRTSANQTGTIQLRPQRIAVDGTTGSYTTTTFDLANAPVGEWTKVSGLTQLTNNARAISGARLYLQVNGSPAGLLIDSVKYVNVNAAQEALAAAQTAQDRANAAHQLAGTAEANAKLAMTAAGQKTRVSYSTAAPSGTASEGDVWRRRDANNVIIGEWVRIGNSWVSTAVSGSMVSNMDIGYLTAGASTIGTAVIQQILTDGVLARIVEAANLVVAARNILPNGDLAQGEVFWDTRMAYSTTDAPPGFPASLSYSGGTIRSNEQRFPLEGGAEYMFEMWIKADKPGSTFILELRNDDGGAHASNGNISLDGNNVNQAGSSLGVYLARHEATTEWRKIRTLVKVNAGVSKAYLGSFYFNHSSASVRDANVSMGGLRLSSRLDGSAVIENTLTADTLVASRELVAKVLGAETAVADLLVANTELWARSATIIAATMGTLTVTEKANFIDAFAEQLYAEDFVARVALIGRLTIAAQNLWGDPDFSKGSYSNWTVVNGGLEKNGTGNQNGTYGSSDITRLPVARGESFVFSADVSWLNGTAGGLGIYRRFVNSSGAAISGYTSQMGTNILRDEALAGRVTRTTDVPTDVPATAVAMEIGFYTQSNMNSSNRVRIENVRVQNALDGRLTIPGTILAEALRVDEIWANTTWQNEAYFGAEDATYRTLINGQGVEVFQKGEAADDGTTLEVPVVQLGTGGDNAFSALVDGEVVGGIGQDGVVTGTRVISSDDAVIAGYPLLGKLLDEEIPSRGEGWSLLDQLPRGVVAAGNRDMSGNSYTSPTHLGFLEIGFEGVWDRMYRLTISPFRAGSSYFQKVVVTYDGSTPSIDMETTSGVQVYTSIMSNGWGGGTYLLSPNTGTVRVLVGMYSASPGLTFPNFTGHVRMWVEDVGSRIEWAGIDRASAVVPASGGGSNTSGNTGVTKKTSYHSAWQPGWFRSFFNGGSSRQATGKGASQIKQGRDAYWASGGIQTGAFGGFTASAIAGETSRTISSALSGANLDSGSIEIRGSYVPGGGQAVARLHWHTLSSAPNSFTSTANYIGDYSISAGGSRRIALPQAVLNAIKNGSFGGFGLTPRGSTDQRYALGISWSTRPVLRLKYTR